MKLSRFSVENSLTVNLLSVFIIIAGIFSIFHLNKEAFPTVSFNNVLITTVFRGASPEKVEKLVTIPIEKELKEVSNLKKIESISSQNISTIVIEISDEVKNTRKVVDDIQKAVDRVVDLPEEVEDRPQVIEITSGEIPVINISINGELIILNCKNIRRC